MAYAHISLDRFFRKPVFNEFSSRMRRRKAEILYFGFATLLCPFGADEPLPIGRFDFLWKFVILGKIFHKNTVILGFLRLEI